LFLAATIDVATRNFSVNARELTIPGNNFAAGASCKNNTVDIAFPTFDNRARTIECDPLTKTTSVNIYCTVTEDLKEGVMEATVELFGGPNLKKRANAPNYKQIGFVIPKPFVTEVTTTIPQSTTTLTITGNYFNPIYTQNQVLALIDLQVRSNSPPLVNCLNNLPFFFLKKALSVTITSGSDTQLVITFTLPQTGGELTVSVRANGGESDRKIIATVTPAPAAVTFPPSTFTPVIGPPQAPFAPLSPQTPFTPDNQNQAPIAEPISPGGIAAAVIVVIVVLAVAGFLVYWFVFRKKMQAKSVTTPVGSAPTDGTINWRQ